MPKSQTTRRALVSGAIAGATAVAATAIAARAAVGAEADPIYAAIERHKAALSEYESVIDREAALAERLGWGFRCYPRVATFPKRGYRVDREDWADGTLVIYSRPVELTEEFYYCYDPKKLADEAQQLPEHERGAWIEAKCLEFQADARRVQEAKDAAGVTDYERQTLAAGQAEREAARDLLRTAPETLAGVAALLRYFCEARLDGLEFPDGWQLSRPAKYGSDLERGFGFGVALAEHAADAIEALAGRGEA